MKGIFDPYVLWPFDKLVKGVRTRNYTVYGTDPTKYAYI